MSNSRVLGFIPARGGSKGVCGKNKRTLFGKPLIKWTIEAAQAATCIDQIIVSTDDLEVAEIGRACDVQVIIRPRDISGDESPVIDAVRHAMNFIENQKQQTPVCIALLQPTAPMRLSLDIDAAIELFFNNGLTPVCSVVRCEDNHPARMYRLSSEGVLQPIFPALSELRRQDLPPIFHRNGAIYVFGQRELEQGKIINQNMLPYEMPASRSLNIDTELDMLTVEAAMANYVENPY